LLDERADEWATCPGILNAACYGLPETRERGIVSDCDRVLVHQMGRVCEEAKSPTFLQALRTNTQDAF
jgi:site-specific DNA-cytosine methylase